MQRARKNQRHKFHANLERLGGEKRRRAESRIIRDGKIIGGNRTRENREIEIANLYLASECCRKFLLDRGPKVVDADEQRKQQNNQNHDTKRDEAVAESLSHPNPPKIGFAGAGERPNRSMLRRNRALASTRGRCEN